MERLQKVIANSGLCSRRKAETYISDGVVKVNGTTVRELGTQVSEEDTILVMGKPISKPTTLTYMVNKPKGVVCSRERQHSEKIVTDLLPKNTPVKPVGRLDKDSEGLLLVTSDGTLLQRLTHPSFEHEKEYEVHCESTAVLTTEQTDRIVAKLLKGVQLGDGEAKADRVRLSFHEGNKITLTITVHEGRHHLIRRMCATLDLKVRKLIRTRIAKLWLGKLKSGQFRVLSRDEYKLLK